MFRNRVRGKCDESVLSFINRTLTANYISHIPYALKLKPQSYRSNFNHLSKSSVIYKEVKELVEKGGGDLDGLLLNQYDEVYLGDKFAEVKGKFGRYYLLNRTKFCPSCMKQDFYHRRLWDIQDIFVCLEHNRYLIEFCPNCNEAVTVKMLMSKRCKCGQLFNNEPDSVPNDEIILHQVDIQRMVLEPGATKTDESGRLVNAILYFTLHHAFKSILESKSGIEFLIQIGKFDHYDPEDIQHRASISQMCWELILNPTPELFSVFFNHLEREIVSGLKKKDFITVLNNSHPIRKMYLRSLDVNKRERNSTYSFHKYIQQSEMELGYITINEAAKVLGFDHHKTLRWAKLGMIPYETSEILGVNTMIFNKLILEEKVKQIKAYIGIDEVKRRFNVSIPIVLFLIKIGKLVPEHGPSKDGFGINLFHPDEIDRFLRKLTETACILNQSDTGWIPLSKRARSITKVLKGAFDGNVPIGIVRDNELNLKNIHIRLSDLKALKTTHNSHTRRLL